MFDKKTVEEMRERGRGRRAFWVLAAVAGVLILVKTAGPGYGRTGGMPLGHGFGRGADAMTGIVEALDHFGASAEQRARVQEIVAETLPVLAELRDARSTLEGRLAIALVADEVPEVELRAIRDDGQALAGETLDVALDLAGRLGQVLTREQRAELVAHWQARR